MTEQEEWDLSGKTARINSPLLGWSPEWGKEKPRATPVIGALFFGFTALISIPFSIEAAESGDSLRMTYGIAFGLVSLTFVTIMLPQLRVRRRNLPRGMLVDNASRQQAGLRFPYLSSWKWTLLAWLVAGAAFIVVRGLMFLSHLLSNDKNSSGRQAIDIGGLAVVACVLAVLVFLLFYAFSGRGRRRGFVRLDETGVSQSFGRTSKSVSWEDISDISACIVSNSYTVRITPVSGTKIQVDTGRSLLGGWQRGFLERALDVPVYVLGIDPPLFLHLVRFYWRHPEARHELGTDAVVDRMQRGDLLG